MEVKLNIRSGAWSDQGTRKSMEDEHILVDDLILHLGSFVPWNGPGSFYGVSAHVI
jgi:hypothetical protein